MEIDLDSTKNNSCECAFYLKEGHRKGYCSDNVLINVMKEFLKTTYNIKPKNNNDTIETLKKITNCDKESCIYKDKTFAKYTGENILNNNLNTRFKPPGPATNFNLLNNINIDEVMEQWSILYKKFLHIPYQMRDFDIVKSELATLNLSNEISKGINCFGVVLNTDYSTGGGIHWFSLFGDFREKPYTLEFFNSSGKLPITEVQIWLERTKQSIEIETNVSTNIIIASKIEHQSDNHSCGPYALYFIWSRLNKVPISYFSNNHIPDEYMHKFREHLFRHYE